MPHQVLSDLLYEVHVMLFVSTFSLLSTKRGKSLLREGRVEFERVLVKD